MHACLDLVGTAKGAVLVVETPCRKCEFCNNEESTRLTISPSFMAIME
jgi:hypothetical protein